MSRNCNLLVSQTVRPIAQCRPKKDEESTIFEHRIGFLRQNYLNQHSQSVFMLGTKYLVTRAEPHIPEISPSTLSEMTFAGITTLPKTTHNISILNTGETSSNYSLKLWLSPPSHKSSHGTFHDSWTVDLLKIPDVHKRLKRSPQPPPSKQFFTKSLA